MSINMQQARILLTGVGGFIGFHLTRRLNLAGATVLGVDNLNTYYDVHLKEARLAELSRLERFTFSRVDIVDRAAMMGAFAEFRPDFVVHLAAQAGVRYSIEQPHAFSRSNLEGFLTVLEACRAHPVRHLIYASSSSVYGTNSSVPFREDDPVEQPVSLYAATKRANELMARTYAHLYDIPSSGLRFFTVYGPWGRPDMAYFSFTKAILAGESIPVFNRGRMRRDFTYVDDVTESIVRLVNKPPSDAGLSDAGGAPHTIYNVGNHTPVELDQFIAAIEKACGRKAQRRNLPMQSGDVPVTYAEISRLNAVTGFSPATSIEDGIERFVSWYRNYYNI